MGQVNGSVEIVSPIDRIGVVGVAWTPEVVPIVVQTLHGITNLESESPERRPTGRTPLNQWSGTDAQGQPVKVLLWEDIPFDETALAKAIASEIAKG